MRRRATLPCMSQATVAARVPLVLHPHAVELAGRGATGFVIVLPGGGYLDRMDYEGPDISAFLAAHGIAAGHLEYPVAPARYPDALEQVLLAVADVRAGVHGPFTGPVSVIGFSAGGHLAATAATATADEIAALARRDPAAELRRPDLVALAYPVISLVNRTHLGSRINLIGADAPEALAAALSVERRVDGDTPPVFCWHTADDASVPVENALSLAGALRDAAVPFELHVYPSGRHGLGLGAEAGDPVAGWPAAWLAWLARGGVAPAPV